MLAAPYSQSLYLPNNGITPDMTPPRPLSFSQTLEARYPEPDCSLPVYILVRPGSPSRPAPRDRPWSLLWPFALTNELLPALQCDPFYHASTEDSSQYAPIACPVPGSGTPGAIHREPGRIIAATRTVEATLDKKAGHFAFWGGCTRQWTVKEMRGARWVLVGVLNRTERMALETLAEQVKVMKAEHGWWNGQNWLVALLNGAVEEMIITPRQRDEAVLAAALVQC